MKLLFTKTIFSIISICFFLAINSASGQLPSGYSSEMIQSGYTEIMGVVFSEDGSKMFVWEKQGKVYVSNWNGLAYIKQSTPVLDISDEVGNWRDFGFASFCLDPDFSNNGLVYMFYMVDREHLMNFGTPAYDPNDDDYYEASISRVTRYKINLGLNPLTTDYSSRMVLLGESVSTGVPLLHESHAGGTILFGADGTLLVSTGDNSSYGAADIGNDDRTYYMQALADGILRAEENVGAFKSQMINSFCGKILRLDPVTGNGLSSNPHYDIMNPRSAQSRMWAMGFRNPFRMSFMHGTGSSNPAAANPGTLFVADVGAGNWEELHIIDKRGLNAGWPLYEGLTPNNSYYNSGATNPDEANVLFVINCPQPVSWTDDVNAANRRYVHNRPEVDWKHGSTEARVPWFDGKMPENLQIGAIGSPTTGNMFTGNTAVAGVYIVGNEMGLAYKNKYFFTDYVKNWIQVGTLKDGSQNWFSDISEFAPVNFGSGIVHMIQNPMNGYIYYANIFNGTLSRIVNNNVLGVLGNEKHAIKIFPNPVSSFIIIDGLTDRAQVSIFDVKGGLLLSQMVENNSKVNINFVPGIYFVKMYYDNKILTKKLVVK